MKKFDLIHTTLLIVGILSGYAALQFMIEIIASTAFFTTSNGDSIQRVPLTLIANYSTRILISAIACYVLIRDSNRFTTLILKKDPEALLDDAPKWDLDRRNIMLVLFIGIGLNTLIQYLPFTVTTLFQLLGGKTRSAGARQNAMDFLVVYLLRITIGTFLIYAAPTLTNFIEKNIAARLDGNTQPRQNV